VIRERTSTSSADRVGLIIQSGSRHVQSRHAGMIEPQANFLAYDARARVYKWLQIASASVLIVALLILIYVEMR
jgi:hypothetical protein